MRAWRISDFADLSGRGGELASARWNHRGDAIIYTAEHPALAMLEILVNLDSSELPDAYQLIEINIPDVLVIHTSDLPERWRDDEQLTRDLWRGFRTQAISPVLRVPSIIMPHCFNLLINPAHPQTGEIKILSAQMHALDSRFLG